jgi:cysteine protease ATG4
MENDKHDKNEQNDQNYEDKSILKINSIQENDNENEETIDNKLYNSVFSIISTGGSDSNSTSSDFKNSIERKESNISFISTGPNDNSISFWQMIKEKLNDIKNKIIFNYNIFSSPYNLSYSSCTKEIQIFEQKFSNHQNILNRVKNIAWFSYRKNFDKIQSKNNIYTSDAGWGCMIRASQMILAQGLFKIYGMKNLKEFINLFLSNFYDNNIPIKYMCKNKNGNKDDDKVSNKSFQNFSLYNSFIFIDSEVVKGLENMSERKRTSEFITPPFSVRNIIKIQEAKFKNCQGAGKFFSNYDTMRLFTMINEHMTKNNDCDYKILNFSEGIIYINKVLKDCFEKVEDIQSDNDFEYLSYSTIQDNNIINNDLSSDKFKFGNDKYKLKNKFILFVSIRHGLYTLNDEMFNEVLNIFDIENNIGFIGGKNNRAFYFIGRCGQNVIFLDPHYVQDTISWKKLGTENEEETYIPNDVFYMPISELSPSLTIGFAIDSMKNFKKLLKEWIKKDYYIDINKVKFEELKRRLFVVQNQNKTNLY